LEGPITNKVTWKAEYLYLDLKTLNFFSAGPFGAEPFSGQARFNDNV
jgi:hypothetical protein